MWGNPQPQSPDPREDLVDYGYTQMFAVGYTEGGAPYGLTIEEWRRGSDRSSRAGLARAKAAIRELAEQQSEDSRVEVDWVEYLGRGLFRTAYTAQLSVEPDPLGLSGQMVALVPHGPMDVSSEARWLVALCARPLPFAVPRLLGATSEGILVESLLAGREPQKNQYRPSLRIAAALHRLPLTFGSDRTTYALQHLRAVHTSTHPDVIEAVAWCEDHLPEGALVLTHGDLRPQNVRIGLKGELGAIDWQLVGPGDPAQELAVLTRGVRRPFELEGGLAAVVDAYHEAGGLPVLEEHVVFYELTMLASWVDARDEQYAVRLKAALRRAWARWP